MAYKPASYANCLQLLIALMVTSASAEQCVLQDKTVSKTNLEIRERSAVRRDVVSVPEGKKCIVDFRVRIGSQWYTAFGEHTWSGAQSSESACGIAVSRAEDDVRQRMGKSQTTSEKILVCKDRPELTTLANSTVGTIGEIGQFRPHPAYLNRFWHNGVQCKWFLEPAFKNHEVQTFQGIICELRPNQWVVVDKF